MAGRTRSRAPLALLAALAACALAALAPAAASAQRLAGIDVSRFQEEIDWQAAAADGVEFAFVQASRGAGRDCSVVPDLCGPDAFYDANYAAARAAGVRVGPYHRAFVGGRNKRSIKADAKAEARVFIAEVGVLQGDDLRPALDLEHPFSDLRPRQLRIWTKAWLKRVRTAFRVKPIIYTNVSSWNSLGDPRWFAKKNYPLWVANWNVSAPQVPADNWAGRSWRIWQHSSSGRVDGISGRVDLNWLRGGYGGLTVAKTTPVPPPPPPVPPPPPAARRSR